MSPMQALTTAGSVFVLTMLVALLVVVAFHQAHMHHLDVGATHARLDADRTYPRVSTVSSRCQMCREKFYVEITGPINVDSLAVCDNCRTTGKAQALTNTTQEA